jgi:hypothetical protein
LSNLFEPFFAQLLGTDRTAFLAPEFPKGDGNRVLLRGRFFGEVFFGRLI